MITTFKKPVTRPSNRGGATSTPTVCARRGVRLLLYRCLQAVEDPDRKRRAES